MPIQTNNLYTPVDRARRRINKARPVKQNELRQNKQNQNLVPTMSEMIRRQAHFMKKAGRIKY